MPATPTLPPGDLVVVASLPIGIVNSNRDAQAFISVLPRARVTDVNFGEPLYKLKEIVGALKEIVGAESLRAHLAQQAVKSTRAADAVRSLDKAMSALTDIETPIS